MTEKRTRADLIDMHKARVEACFEDYRLSLLAYAEWMDDFRKRTGRMHPLLPLDQAKANSGVC